MALRAPTTPREPAPSLWNLRRGDLTRTMMESLAVVASLIEKRYLERRQARDKKKIESYN